MMLFHLVRRALTSFRNHPLGKSEIAVAQDILLPDEFAVWSRMQHRDQRHSLEVLQRFQTFYAVATRDELAAALLHDVGKCESSLRWSGRILATVIGPRTREFQTYLDHEMIGMKLLASVSTARTLELLRGEPDDACVKALRRADNI